MSGARNRKRTRRHVKHYMELQQRRWIIRLGLAVLFVMVSVAGEICIGNILSRTLGILFILAAIFMVYQALVVISEKFRVADRFKTGVEVTPTKDKFS